MEHSDDHTTTSRRDESQLTTPVNILMTDGSPQKSKKKKNLRIDPSISITSKARLKLQPKKPKCDREDEHHNPPWINNYKPIYGPPLISSFLIIDIQKIFRKRFDLPLLHRITRSEGIDLLAELLGMYDLETNIISYWTLDVLSQVIRKCQSISMKEENIKMCILWIHYILYTIHRNHPTRKKLFKHLCMMFNRAIWKLPELVAIPHPYHLKQELEKLHPDKSTAVTSEKKVEEMMDTMTILEEEPRFIAYEEGGPAEEFEELEEDSVEGELRDISPEESSSQEEEDLEEEVELEPEEGSEDISESSIEEISLEEFSVGDEYHLPDEANDLPDEIKEELYFIAHEITETRKLNKRDFFHLIKIIYRIFANRFKYTVIWEAFVNPPIPKIIGIGNNIKIPKKVKTRRPPPASKLNVRMRGSLATRKTMVSVAPKKSSVVEGSLVKRYFPSLRKKRNEKAKKQSKYIRPLAEAVNKRFFEVLADHKYKEVKYEEFVRRMEAIRTRLNIKRRDYNRIREDLKALLARSKRKRNVHRRPGRGTRAI